MQNEKIIIGKKVVVMNVPFDAVTRRGALGKVAELLEIRGQHIIVTPNPEMLLAAQKNDRFLHVLQNADLGIPDGTGIIWAASTAHLSPLCAFISLFTIPFKKNLSPLPERVTGADLFMDICELAAQKEKKVFLLGAGEGIAKNVKKNLTEKIPNIQIVGRASGTPKPEDEDNLCALINHTKPDILFVAYGAPAQELWITKNLPRLPSVKIAMGVGGTFDYIANKRKRAPLLLQKAGLEWLYRLIQEPKRWRRIYNAIITFPIEIIRRKTRK